jgi:hypothetical protein
MANNNFFYGVLKKIFNYIIKFERFLKIKIEIKKRYFNQN